MTRLLIAAATALAVSLLGTKYLIKLLTVRRIGQHIREEGPQHHQVKAGTPTMGGLAIVGGAFAGYVISNLYHGIYTRTGLVVMVAIVGAGIVGFLDDWIKIRRARNLGLTKRTKLGGQLIVAIGFAVAMVNYAHVDTHLSFARPIAALPLGSWAWAGLAVLWILGLTNAVNLTDGLDGLAAGSSALGFAAYTVIAFWQFRNQDVYGSVPHALDLSVIAVSMMAACVGFLWWNANPARIFMGDAGSLALGGAFATLALATDTVLLLPILGGLFVVETVSVMVQVAAYRMQRGVPPAQRRRPFRMAPLHHHFELGGWPETTVIIRFWIIAGLCTAVALGLFYADFLAKGGVDL